jgi:small conductance mechanosensitive channel
MPEVARFSEFLPALIGASLATGVLWLLLQAATRSISRAAKHMEDDGWLEESALWAKRLTRFVRYTFTAIAVITASVVMLRGVGVRGLPRLSVGDLTSWLMGPGLRLLIIAASAFLLIKVVGFLADSFQMFLVSRDGSQADLLEQKKRVETLGQLLRVVASVLISGVALLMVLSLFGLDIRPVLTGAGIAGLAVGFGAQNLVRDVISGFFLILENQVRLGDVVSINGKGGLVESIRLRTISLRGLDGTVHVIPNGAITELSNMTKDFSYALLDIGVAYKENVDTVVEVLEDAARQLQADPIHGPKILEPLDVLGVDAFGDSAVVIKVRLKTVPIQQWSVAREYRRRIKMAFDARGIEIPFPHLSVYFGDASKPVAVQVARTEPERA